MNVNPNAPPPFGVYTPLVTFFHEDESLDLESISKHVLRMAEGKVTGLVIQGSNGEAPHLLHDERKLLVSTVKETLNKNGFPGIKLVVGCGAASVRETLLYLSEAREAGADYGLILPPAYWTAGMSAPVIEKFYRDVADSAAMPFLIYNFPGVTGGIDISSDSIISLAKENPAIVGVKLTCGNVGKLQRVASALPGGQFAALAGKSDFCLPALVAGSHGVIAALANLVPKLHSELLRLYEAGDLKAAIELQSKLSNADWALLKSGVAGVKKTVADNFGYGCGKSRRPLGNGPPEVAADVSGPINLVVALEKSLT